LVGLFLGGHPPEHGEKLVSLVAGHLLSLLCAVVHLGDNGIIDLKREAKNGLKRTSRHQHEEDKLTRSASGTRVNSGCSERCLTIHS